MADRDTSSPQTFLPLLLRRLERQLRPAPSTDPAPVEEDREDPREPLWSRHSKAELLALQEVYRAVGSSLDPAEVLGVVVDRVAELLGAARCSVLLAARESGAATVVASHERGEAPTNLDLARYPEIRKALGEGAPVVIEDIHHDPLLADVRAHLATLPAASVVVLPIRTDDLVVGALFVRSREPGRGFAPREVQLLEAISALAGQALDRSLQHEIVADTAHRAALEREVVQARYELLQDYAELLEHTSDAILSVDVGGRITAANRRATDITGYAHPELVGMRIARVLPPAEIERILRLRGQSEPAEREQYHLKIEDAQGRGLGVRVSIERRPEGGEVVTLRDNSAEKRYEERMAAVNARLVELGHLKSAFIARASHELKTPLNVVSGYLKLLEGDGIGPLNDDQREILTEARAAVRDLEALASDLLDVAKLEAGRSPIDAVPADLAEAARRAVRRFEILARDAGVELRLEAPEPVEAAFDPLKIDQVLANLLANAVKFTPRGGRVVVRVGRSGTAARVDVEDTGPGVPAEDRERIFEEFARLRSGDRDVPGAGLGLSIVRRIVEAHGGTVAAGEASEGGALFTVTLPTLSAASEAA